MWNLVTLKLTNIFLIGKTASFFFQTLQIYRFHYKKRKYRDDISFPDFKSSVSIIVKSSILFGQTTLFRNLRIQFPHYRRTIVP